MDLFPVWDWFDEAISSALYGLTETIATRTGVEPGHGLLGGEWGYGCDYENDVFRMHPYCWCGREDCAYCGHHAPLFFHKASGFSVYWYKYIGRDMEFSRFLDVAEWHSILGDCLASLPEGAGKV